MSTTQRLLTGRLLTALERDQREQMFSNLGRQGVEHLRARVLYAVRRGEIDHFDRGSRMYHAAEELRVEGVVTLHQVESGTYRYRYYARLNKEWDG